MRRFIDDHRGEYGVESICKVMPIAPSTYYEEKIRHVWEENGMVYGARKVWLHLKGAGFVIARCTVARLMAQMGLRGVVRGKKRPITTVAGASGDRRQDLVNRQFVATRPNQLWIADFTYVTTWLGFVYVAFVIDVFSRMIVGWRVSSSMKGERTLDALEQALWARDRTGELIHHRDHGSQYRAIRYTESLLEEGIDPTVGSVGDSYDNAMAESIIGLFKTEMIRPAGPWRNLEAVEYVTLEWVDWFNNRRLLGSIADIPPVEFEPSYHKSLEDPAVAAGLN
jgi:transposase InsO family protein